MKYLFRIIPTLLLSGSVLALAHHAQANTAVSAGTLTAKDHGVAASTPCVEGAILPFASKRNL